MNSESKSQGSDRVVRDGSWLGYARHARSACRGAIDPGFRSIDLGFRVVKESILKRVFRGGSYGFNGWHSRSNYRNECESLLRGGSLGFRVVKEG